MPAVQEVRNEAWLATCKDSWNYQMEENWSEPPVTVENKNQPDYKIHKMTMIDPTTGWCEVATVKMVPLQQKLKDHLIQHDLPCYQGSK